MMPFIMFDIFILENICFLEDLAKRAPTLFLGEARMALIWLCLFIV